MTPRDVFTEPSVQHESVDPDMLDLLADVGGRVASGLTGLIRAFAKEYDYPVRSCDLGRGDCDSVSNVLVDFLEDHGVSAVLLSGEGFVPPLGDDAEGLWIQLAGDKAFQETPDKGLMHVVVLVGDTVVDLTGRQFGSDYADPTYSLSEFKQRWDTTGTPRRSNRRTNQFRRMLLRGVLASEDLTPSDVHDLADDLDIPWDDDPDFMAFCEQVVGEQHLDDMTPEELGDVADAMRRSKEAATKGEGDSRVLQLPVRALLPFRQKGNPIEADHCGDVDGRYICGDDFEYYNALVQSIRKHGVQKPLELAWWGAHPHIVDGHHRLNAAWEAGVKTVPVQVDGTITDEALQEWGLLLVADARRRSKEAALPLVDVSAVSSVLAPIRSKIEGRPNTDQQAAEILTRALRGFNVEFVGGGGESGHTDYAEVYLTRGWVDTNGAIKIQYETGFGSQFRIAGAWESLVRVVRAILAHEMVHRGQMQRIRDSRGPYAFDQVVSGLARNISQSKETSLSSPHEIHAWARQAIEELRAGHYSVKDILQNLRSTEGTKDMGADSPAFYEYLNFFGVGDPVFKSLVRSIVQQLPAHKEARTGGPCEANAQGVAWVSPEGRWYAMPSGVGHGTWVVDQLVYTMGLFHRDWREYVTVPKAVEAMALAFEYQPRPDKVSTVVRVSPKYKMNASVHRFLAENGLVPNKPIPTGLDVRRVESDIYDVGYDGIRFEERRVPDPLAVKQEEMRSALRRGDDNLRGQVSDSAYYQMFDLGWVRVANVFAITLGKSTSEAAGDSWCEHLLGCLPPGVDVEGRVMHVDGWGGLRGDVPVVDVVEHLCSRSMQERFWSHLMGGHGKTAGEPRYKKKKKVPKADGSGETTVYVYSERQVQNRNRQKAERLEKLRHSIDDLMEQVRGDLDDEDPKVRLTALAVGLIDAVYERVGNDGSADEGHYGVTGWLKEHVTFSKGKARIKYVGKSGVEHDKEVTDKKLVTALKGCCEDKKPDEPLLSFGKDDSDGVVRVTSRDVNAYLDPYDISAKDLRGFHANSTMQEELRAVRKRGGKLPDDKKEREKLLKAEFKEALEATAEAVGHEPGTLKSQYLVPGMEGQYLKDGTVNDNLKVASGQSWYHLTDRAKFKIDPKFTPADNTIALEDRSGRAGIYLGTDVERWVNGQGYWRPFVVEFEVDPSVKDDTGVGGRWGGEMFVPASSFDKITVKRVIPLDAYAREQYADYGWIEEAIGRTFDTGEPIKQHGFGEPYRRPFPGGYHYTGPDVRNMPSSDVSRLKQDLRKAKGRSASESGASSSRVASRYLQARDICNPNVTSAAWISPDGEVHMVFGTHSEWAEDYLVKNPEFWKSPKGPAIWLLNKGWVRVVNFLVIEIDDFTTEAAMKATAEVVVGCASKRSDVDPETTILIDDGSHSREVPIGDFVAEWGGPAVEKRFYESLSRRGKWATKSDAEKEDAEAERLVRPSPKLKPPRSDKKREKMQVEDDPDMGSADKDLSLNYKDVGG